VLAKGRQPLRQSPGCQANPDSNTNCSTPNRSGTFATHSPTCTAAFSNRHSGTSTKLNWLSNVHERIEARGDSVLRKHQNLLSDSCFDLSILTVDHPPFAAPNQVALRSPMSGSTGRVKAPATGGTKMKNLDDFVDFEDGERHGRPEYFLVRQAAIETTPRPVSALSRQDIYPFWWRAGERVPFHILQIPRSPAGAGGNNNDRGHGYSERIAGL